MNKFIILTMLLFMGLSTGAYADLLDGLLVRYDFDDGLSDSSSNGRDGISGGGEVVSGGNLVLDGSATSFVDIPLGAANPLDGSSSYTISIKFQATTINATTTNLLLLTSARTSNVHFFDSTDDPFAFFVTAPGVVFFDYWWELARPSDDNVDYLDGQMHSATLLGINPIQGKFEFFGDQEPNGSVDHAMMFGLNDDGAAQIVRIGASADTDPLSNWLPDLRIEFADLKNFEGEIDYIAIYNRTLTPAEIAALDNVWATCSGFSAPMASYPVKAKKNRVFPLKMELLDGDGTMLTDVNLVAPPVVQVMFMPANGGPSADVSSEALAAGQGSDGNQFTFTSNGVWQFNLQSRNYRAKGEYVVTAVSGDGLEYTINPACVTSFVVQ